MTLARTLIDKAVFEERENRGEPIAPANLFAFVEGTSVVANGYFKDVVAPLENFCR